MTDNYPAEFWKVFDQAVKNAELTTNWKETENILRSVKQSISIVDEEKIYTSYLQQWTAAMYELYKLTTLYH